MALEVLVRPISPYTPKEYDFLFTRKNSARFGVGTALVLSATGHNRIQELNRMWQEICQSAVIDDQVGIASVGLTAFTSITFSPKSKTESQIIIPRQLIINQDDRSYEVLILNAPLQSPIKRGPAGKFDSGQQSAEHFSSNVEKAITQIKTTDLEKVVLSRDLVMPVTGEPSLFEPLARLHRRYPDCWTYKIAGVFGASPELLIRGERGEVSARVLAGTAGRGTDPDVDRAISNGLTHSNKNIHEHAFAVQSMVNELSPFCEWVEADSEPFSLALPDLWHLATDVKGKLKPDTSLLDVIAQLHPTAAVAGTPRQHAMELIDQLEGYDRGGYAGPVGWLAADGSGELAIALRGGVIESNQIRAIAGCGIVAESEPEAELAETELKFRAVRFAFDS